MGGDYTRVTFDPVKGFSGLHKQQGRVSLDWEFNELEEILDRRDRAEMYDVAGQTFVPATTPDGFKIGVGGSGQLTIAAGRLYVDGILAECFGDMSSAAATIRDDNLGGVHGPGPVDYDKQPFFYQPDYPALSAVSGTTDLVYLDVWQREVTVFEDPALREIALNGPDTATRVQTAWQVKVLQDVPPTSCATAPPAWTALTAPSTARISAQTTPVAPAPGPCVINPAGGYTGLENRLYRVEIHRAGTLDGGTPAQFKWSRDNASLAARVLSITAAGVGQSVITVASTGRDAWMRFEHGDHIELVDDHVEWAMRETGIGGSMATIVAVNHATGEIQIDQDLSAFGIAAARHPRIRRWDIASAAEPLVRDVNNGTPIPLEEGITVTFGQNATDTLHAGDYIVFAARTADGTIDVVDNAPPLGILHHFARLAVVAAGSPPTVLTDCRVPPTTTTQEGCCTVVVKPGESIQAALDSLPDAGGCVCLKVGDHPVVAPIVIRKSNVVLHGESIGARVLSGSSRKLLIIGDFNAGGVTEVTVHDIRFETSGGPADTANPDRDALVAIVSGGRIAVQDCEIRLTKPAAMSGVVVFGSRDVRVDRNAVEGALVGIRTVDDCQRVTVRDNTLSGFSSQDLDFGVLGVMMIRVLGACEVTGNHISGFVEGVRVTQITETDGGSLILANVIDRRRPPDSADTTPLWGIDVEGRGPTIRDNSVAIVVSRHGGIHGIGVRVHIEDNDVHSAARDGVVPSGILLEGETRPGQVPFEGDGVVSANRLRGRLTAIGVRHCRGAEVLGTDARLGGVRGSTGIAVVDSHETLVSSNVIAGADTAIGALSSSEVRITSNQLDSGQSGIMAVRSEALLIADNVIDTMAQFGIGTASIARTTTVSRNRLVRCCAEDTGTAVAAIVAGQASDEIVVEFNDVLDTGINQQGKLVGAVDGIHLVQSSRSRVQGNHVYYSKPDTLQRDLECRALRLEGDKAKTTLDGLTNNWALVLDNSFVGVGLTALVEIAGATPLQRVTFSQNYCEHYNVQPGDQLATVSMTAELMVVQGNQIKAEQRFTSFDFHRHGQVTFIGNIAFPARLPPGAIPLPPPSFNIIL